MGSSLGRPIGRSVGPGWIGQIRSERARVCAEMGCYFPDLGAGGLYIG